MMDNYKCVLKLKINNFVLMNEKPLDPSKRLKIDFCGFFSKILADFLALDFLLDFCCFIIYFQK